MLPHQQQQPNAPDGSNGKPPTQQQQMFNFTVVEPTTQQLTGNSGATTVKKTNRKEKKDSEKETTKKKKKKDDSKEIKKEKKEKNKESSKRKETPEKVKEEKKAKKKKSDSPQIVSSSSGEKVKQTVDNMEIDVSEEEIIKSVFEDSTKQVIVEIKFLDSSEPSDEDVILSDDNTPIVNGTRIFEDIDWNGVLVKDDLFNNFTCELILAITSEEGSLTVGEYKCSIMDSLGCTGTTSKHPSRNRRIVGENYIFKHNIQTKSITMTFNKCEEITELAEILQKRKVRQELEEAEEIEAQDEINAAQINDIQVNFEFNFENEQNKKFVLELRAPKSNSYKSSIEQNLQLSENDLLHYSEKASDVLVEASAVLPSKLKDILSSKVDVKVVHRQVYYEQRVISYEIFERMKNIIEQDKFSSFNNFSFLVCTPDQNTLWHQTMERLERSNILPPNKKVSSVSIKYRKDHLPTFEKFRNSIKTDKDTLFIIIVDECHYAITKEGAHDKIVNDQLALEHDNFFVLLVSATPYNVLSVDSNIPEVYKLLSDFEELEKGTKVNVVSTSYEKSGIGLLIKSYGGSSEYEFIKMEDQKSCLQQVSEITGKILPLMSDENEELNFEIGDIVKYKESESKESTSTNTNNNKLKIKRYTVTSLVRGGELEKYLSDRDLRKINPSKTKRTVTKEIGSIKEGSLVEIHDTIKWKVTFEAINHSSKKQYTLNDWEFKKLTNYEEYNVVSWSDVQRSTNLERTEKDVGTKKYFSKQDYINSLKKGDPLIFKDSEFEKILKKLNIASNTLRPIMLAIDYHFWIIMEGIRLNRYSDTEAYQLLSTVHEKVPDIDEQQRRYVELCKLVYLSYMSHKYCGTADILTDTCTGDEDDDVDYETKKTVKEKKEKTEIRIKEIIDKLNKNSEPQKQKQEQVFSKVAMSNISSLTKNLINSLIESGQIPQDGTSLLRGKMKILRITTTDFANTVYKLLRYSISKIPHSRYISPDVLIDTGENPLTLDHLSLVSRMKLAEKVLSSEDYKSFQKNPNRLSKKTKSLEYINLQNFPCILILVAKGRQGDTFPNSFDCLDMRAKGDSLPNYSSFTQEFGRLCRYVDSEEKKPIALVTDSIFKDLSKCGEGGATSVGNTSMNLDTYMTKMKGKEGQKYWSIVTYCRRTMAAVDGKKLKNEKSSRPSYDYGRSGTDKDISKKLPHIRRILLFAEPQIGKTDSFLHFLERVMHGIETNRMERMIYENEEPDDTSIIEETPTKTYSSLEMALPYFKDLDSQERAPYEKLSAGKYAKLVLKTREEVFKEFLSDPIRSVHKLSRIESSLLSSELYWNKFIEKLGNNSFNLLEFQTFDGRYTDIGNPEPSPNSKALEILKIGGTSKVDLSDKMNIGLADINYNDKLITVELQCVFGLSIGSLEECFPSEKPKISIPANKLDWFQISSDQKSVTRFVSLNDPNSVRSWIFMPSWNRSAGGLFYLKSMTIPYRQVIAVRNSEFKCYIDVLGSDFVILSLPDVIDFTKLTSFPKPPKLDSRTTRYDHTVDDTLLSGYQIKDDVGCIGFSRLVIQLLANEFHLDFIWMMDDNCHHFEKVENGQKVPCPVSDVLLPLERIVYDEEQIISTIDNNLNVSDLAKMNRLNPANYCSNDDKINCFTPGKDNIAVIGIRKDGYRYCPDKNYKPFVKSFTICSLFLLNAKKTVEKGCLFPARRYLEDIEFEYLCLENDLCCIKSQNYFLYKPANPLKIDYQPPSNVPTMYEINETELSKVFTNIPLLSPSSEFSDICESISKKPNVHIFNNFEEFFNNFKSKPECEEYYVFLPNVDLGSKGIAIQRYVQCIEELDKSKIVTYYSPQQDINSAKEIILKFKEKNKKEKTKD